MIHFQKQVRQVNKIKPKENKKNIVPLKKALSFMGALCNCHKYDTYGHQLIILSNEIYLLRTTNKSLIISFALLFKLLIGMYILEYTPNKHSILQYNAT